MKPEPTYSIKDSQQEASKRGNLKKKKRRFVIKQLFGNDIISKYIFSANYK